MKNKKKIQDEYKKKVNRLINLNKAYFDKDKPIVSDSEFDKLKQELINISKKYTFLKKIKDLNKIVGFKPSTKFEKVKHSKPMLSLGNAFEKKDIIDFKKKISNFLNFKSDIQFSAEPKIDGISSTLRYEKGDLVFGLSRGDGIFGENITENLATIKDIPKKVLNAIELIQVEHMDEVLKRALVLENPEHFMELPTIDQEEDFLGIYLGSKTEESEEVIPAATTH